MGFWGFGVVRSHEDIDSLPLPLLRRLRRARLQQMDGRSSMLRDEGYVLECCQPVIRNLDCLFLRVHGSCCVPLQISVLDQPLNVVRSVRCHNIEEVLAVWQTPIFC